MKRLLIGFLAGLVLGSLAHGQAVNHLYSTAQTFSSGGTVWLRLGSGDYTVRAGASDRIVVRWSPEDLDKLDEMNHIKVRTEISGAVATIHTEGPVNHARFVIELPMRSDLFLRMRAGDITFEGIEGNKDLRMTAGELKVLTTPELYSRVHASATFGEVEARQLGISKGGIKRSFTWKGSGKYKLHASLFAGEVSIF
jgi:hypothetical protein